DLHSFPTRRSSDLALQPIEFVLHCILKFERAFQSQSLRSRPRVEDQEAVLPYGRQIGIEAALKHIRNQPALTDGSRRCMFPHPFQNVVSYIDSSSHRGPSSSISYHDAC